jgi:hypothetical protein
LPMHPDTPSDLGFAEPFLEEPRRLHATPLQLDTVKSYSGWMSHAGKYT